jgi:hypothetical protein
MVDVRTMRGRLVANDLPSDSEIERAAVKVCVPECRFSWTLYEYTVQNGQASLEASSDGPTKKLLPKKPCVVFSG